MSAKKRKREPVAELRPDGATTATTAATTTTSFTDFKCLICLRILIEPVVLTCRHEFCLQCFERYHNETNNTCPLCPHVRISNWVRERKKKNLTLVDIERWNYIQKTFPDQIQRRLSGLDDDSSEDIDLDSTRIIAAAGEVHHEYETELERVAREREEEEARDREFTLRLVEEERRSLEEAEEQDRAAALLLQQEELGDEDVSPAEEQRKILELFRPRSPRKLRGRDVERVKRRKTLERKEPLDVENRDPEQGSSKTDGSETPPLILECRVFLDDTGAL